MPIRAVGLLSPGDMGQVVGRVLLDRGVSVKTCLEDRSKGTQERARQAGIGAVPNYVQLVRNTDLILSILVPAEAKKVAETVAQALVEAGEQTVYVWTATRLHRRRHGPSHRQSKGQGADLWMRGLLVRLQYRREPLGFTLPAQMQMSFRH